MHVRACQLSQHVGVEAIRLAAGDLVAGAGRGERVRVHGHDPDACLEQPVDEQALRPLDGDATDAALHEQPAEPAETFLVVADTSLEQPSAPDVDEAQPVLLARPVDPRDHFHHLSPPARVWLRPDREVPWRVLIGGPSVGRRPVAAPGASHRREALVSRGPSTRQATLALSRRRSATERPYGSHREVAL
jgi:hypothetical protein